MHLALEFLLGRLHDSELPAFSYTEFTGPHSRTLRLFRALGFLDNPIPNTACSCPHCDEGVPYFLEDAWICSDCNGEIPEEHLSLWPFHLEAFLAWFVRAQKLAGFSERIDASLWRLGSAERPPFSLQCFFLQSEECSREGLAYIRACHNALVLYVSAAPPPIDEPHVRTLRISEVLRCGVTLSVVPLFSLLRSGGPIVFTPSGGLWAGDVYLGRLGPRSREYWLVDCLYRQRDRLVSFEKIKEHVLANYHTSDEDSSPAFCQKLKHRIKTRHQIREADKLVQSWRNAQGYLMPAALSVGDM